MGVGSIWVETRFLLWPSPQHARPDGGRRNRELAPRKARRSEIRGPTLPRRLCARPCDPDRLWKGTQERRGRQPRRARSRLPRFRCLRIAGVRPSVRVVRHASISFGVQNNKDAQLGAGSRLITDRPTDRPTCVSVDEDEVKTMAGSSFDIFLDLAQQRRPRKRRYDVVRILVRQADIAEGSLIKRCCRRHCCYNCTSGRHHRRQPD